jgi:hypothetical protein
MNKGRIEPSNRVSFLLIAQARLLSGWTKRQPSDTAYALRGLLFQ